MRTFHHNGEYWYEQTDGPFARLARWVAWFGGFETWLLARRRGKIPTTFADLRHHVYPISLFGHRISFQAFGVDVRTPWGFLCLHRDLATGRPYAYISRDATPQNAHAWLLNPPPAVVRSARAVDEDYQYFRKRLNDLGLS